MKWTAILPQVLAWQSAFGFVLQRPPQQHHVPAIQHTRVADTRLYASSSSSSSTTATPEPLAAEGDWTAYLDEESTGLVYFFNGKTGESRWVPPTNTFPSVKLSRSQKRIAEEKQKQYRTAAKQNSSAAATGSSDKKGFFTSMIKDKAEKKEEEDWFSFLATPKDEGVPARKETVKYSSETLDEAPADVTAASTSANKAVKKEGFFDKLVAKTRERVAQTDAVSQAGTDSVDESAPVAVINPEIAGFVLAAPQKMSWGGEDAIFTKSRTFGVFDGVSGAEKVSGRPLYSKMLAQLCEERVGADQALNIQDMQKILLDSIKICNEEATGATTALLASIGPDGFLRVLNIGDASLVVVRGDKVVARTKEISHFYECPYQFSDISPDKPRDGTKLNCELVKGDLLISGSDGIFDNLADDVLLEVIQTTGTNSASVLAKAVGEKARKVSLDRKAKTPYAIAAKKQNNPDFADGLGGKVDDVSCVVVRYE